MNSLLRLLPEPTQEWVAKQAIKELAAGGVDPDRIRFKEQDFEISADGRHIFLGNLHALCRTLWPWQRRAAIRQFLGSFCQTPDRPESFDEARAQLLPGVRDSFMFEALRLRALIEGQDSFPPAGFALGTRLWMGLFLDFPDSTSIVGAKDLEEWGVTFEEVLEAALENLATRSGQDMVSVSDGLYHSPWQDCYDPARILRRETFSELPLSGDPVVVIPNWNHLILTGAEDPGGLATAIAFSQKVLEEEPRPMSALPLVRRNGEWMNLDLPRGHPVEPLLRKARVLELSAIYEEQSGLLERLHERQERDVYVGKYNGLRDEKEDEYDSYCRWSKGVPTLLPTAERVVFFDDDRPEDEKVAADVRWDVMRLHCSHLLRDTGDTPARFLVEEFPSDEQLAALAASAGNGR